MERFLQGIGEKGFLQKNVVKGFPDWLRRVEAPKKGGVVHYPIATDRRSLQWLANQNTITLDVWTSRAPARTIRTCVLDLDPRTTSRTCCAQRSSRPGRPQELGHESWVKTSGSKGYHVVARPGIGPPLATRRRWAERRRP
ncbi:MAG: hypothetical protein R2712_11545 [Vicinamibacterales bacterium]